MDKRRMLNMMLMLCALSVPAWATVVQASNSIGQYLQGVPTTEWSHVIDGNKTMLMHGDSVVRTTTRNGNVQTDVAGDVVATTTFKDNRPILEELTTPTHSQITRYTYDEAGRLSKVVVSGPDGIEELTQYAHGPDGSMVAFQQISIGQYPTWDFQGDGWYATQRDGVGEQVTLIGNDTIIRKSLEHEGSEPKAVFQRMPDGSLIVTEGAITRTFNPKGLLVHEEQGDEIQSTFQYDGQGTLVESESRSGTGRTLSKYVDGHLSGRQLFQDNTVVKEVAYASDGTRTETLYEDGIAYADITYAPDGARVLSVRYR